ncbi:MAG: hypothetical protein JOZ69_25125 [Myxococcales bacterium]|nr:hypothetical protein [Myxococcales bacterium]
MRAGGAFERLSAIGAAAQASVPGAYAWGVTVLPCAWARAGAGAGITAAVVAKLAAGAALVALTIGVAAERRFRSSARIASLWAFVGSSGIVWWAAPSGLAASRLDTPQGFAGLLGWALFAVASAAPAAASGQPPPAYEGGPAQGASAEDGVDEASEPLVPRDRPLRGDLTYVGAAALVAAVLQAIGWRAAGTERSLLVRLVALATGLAIIGAGAQLAVARHARRSVVRPGRRLRRALIALAALALLAVSGLLFWLRT